MFVNLTQEAIKGTWAPILKASGRIVELCSVFHYWGSKEVSCCCYLWLPSHWGLFYAAELGLLSIDHGIFQDLESNDYQNIWSIIAFMHNNQKILQLNFSASEYRAFLSIKKNIIKKKFLKTLLLVIKKMSFKNTLNNNGLKTVSWGAPTMKKIIKNNVHMNYNTNYSTIVRVIVSYCQ